MVIYVPSVTGYILIEPYDIAEFLILYILSNSYFLNKPVVILNFSILYNPLRDNTVYLFSARGFNN